MVLWKKESISDNACYIDLLSSNQIDRVQFEDFKKHFGYFQRSEYRSLEERKQGNELFRAKKWVEAMTQYNKSIRFAPDESEALAIGYANRAACFFHLEKYDKCLVDIELAKKAKYPQNLMHKLDERKAACLKEIKQPTDIDEDGEATVKAPELSYNPNAKFPGMANVLEVRTNDEFGKHVVAKRDIGVGQIVLLEDAFAFVGNNDFENICKTCAKVRMNLIPCPNCVDEMFCNAKCMDSNDMHKMVCGALYNRWNNPIVETILIAVSAFPNAASLMKFVESALATRDVDSPECAWILQTKYRLFLKLFVSPTYKNLNETRQAIFDAYKLALDIPHIEQFFRSTQEKRFLMHLIGHHHGILETNSFGSLDVTTESNYMSSIGICSSLFNHSCVPNILRLNHGNKMIGYVQRPVKKGEQLFIDYFHGADIASIGQKNLNFECKCSKCVPSWKEQDRIRMQSDANYLFFARSGVEAMDFKDPKNRSVFKPKFQNWFTKFGRLPWSPEFVMMESGFVQCFAEDFVAWDY